MNLAGEPGIYNHTTTTAYSLDNLFLASLSQDATNFYTIVVGEHIVTSDISESIVLDCYVDSRLTAVAKY
jgi:hypothetical protein